MRYRASFLALAVLVFGFPTVAQDIAPGDRQSGANFMSAELQAMQRDDTANPVMLWVQEGEAAWQAAPTTGKPACSGCHGDATKSMRGVAARYPAYDEKSHAPVDLEERINICRTDHQNATPLAWESPEMLALSSYIALQARGMPVTVANPNGLRPFSERGNALFHQRQGQLNLSCAACHDSNWGKRLASSPIPQAHANAYPIYRLEWQGMGSLQRRLRNCMIGMRAEPFAYGSDENRALEIYLAERAVGMPMESPGIRP